MAPGSNSFYGVASIGTKGQIVIPAAAREEMGVQPGDKVIIFGKKLPGQDYSMVAICPISSAEQFVESLTKHLNETQAALKQAKEDSKK